MTTMPATAGRAEQTRARYPDDEGYVERDGVRVFWELYGSGEPTILLLPTWSIIHSRHWKGQIPYLARHARVLTFDGRGNGRSDRPEAVDAYAEREFAADALAVMDAAGVERAVVVGLSAGALWGVLLAAEHPERVAAAVFIAAAAPFAQHAARVSTPFDEPLESYEGWAKYNRHYWLEDYRDFLEFFFGQVFTEPHSTKQIEDCVGWGLETTPETLALTYLGRQLHDPAEFTRLCERIACPVLVIHGTDDAVRPFEVGAELARVTGGALVALEGSGHCPHARDPVRVNRLLREFVVPGAATAQLAARTQPSQARALHLLADRARSRPARHRDRPRAAPPAPRSRDRLARAAPRHRGARRRGRARASGEPAARQRVAPHRVRVGRARPALLPGLAADGRDPRRQLHGLRRRRPRASSTTCGSRDEGWEIDYYLHENPECKRAAYAWLTDFVGWLPMPDGGEHEAALTADYNAEMIEQIARFPRVRDRAIFVGNPDDIVPEAFGPGLAGDPLSGRPSTTTSPATSRGSTRATLSDRERLRAELGYRVGRAGLRRHAWAARASAERCSSA